MIFKSVFVVIQNVTFMKCNVPCYLVAQGVRWDFLNNQLGGLT